MSICSDVEITREDARKRVKSLIMHDQERLIDSAIKGMQDWELTSYLNDGSDLYYFSIEKKVKGKK